MNENSKLPEIPPSALREHGTDDRVERVWQRLESELGAQRPRPRNVWLWAPAAALIVFGSGVLVGARWVHGTPKVPTLVAAEPVAPSDDLLRPEQAPAGQLGKPDEQSQGKDKRSGAPGHPSTAGSAAPTGAVEQPTPPTASLPPVLAQPEWQSLADNSEYAAAWRSVERQGGFDAVLGKGASAEQLMTLADVARANGQRAAAIRAYRAVVDQHGADPRAALAWWTLGDMLEKGGDRAGAAQAYAAYRALSPKGDFAEDALARQFDAAIAQGNVDLAKQLADQYAKDFPNGRRLGEIRSRVGKLSGVNATPAGTDAGRAEDETPWDEVDDEAAPPAKSGQKPAK